MKKFVVLLLSLTLILSGLATVSFASESIGTSTSYRYENRFNAALVAYNDFSVITDEYFAIPGLENTALPDGESCSCMTPQGLCVTEEYVFISAYCGVKRYKSDLEANKGYGNNAEKLKSEENHKVHNSVIYILERETGAYLKTLVLPDSNHVGGLATDGENLFIAKSTDNQVSVITAAQLELIFAVSTDTVLPVNYAFSIDCGCTASFVTYYNDILWVGVFDEENNGTLKGFEVSPVFSLKEITSVEIPAKANGASFCELNGEVCLSVNTSYGRKNVSKIYLYAVSDYGLQNMTLDEKDTYTVPPTVQNSAVIDGKVYYIYESAATCYSQVESLFETKSTSCPIDRVCVGEAENLFNWHCDNFLFVRISALVRAIKTAVEGIF